MPPILSDLVLHGWHVWVLIGMGLFALETLLPGFYLASLGAGAVLTAITAHLGWSLTNQLLAFAALTLLVLLTFRPIMLRVLRSNEPDLKTGHDALIGTNATVANDIKNAEEQGRIKAAGSLYNARSSDGTDIEAGQIVTIERFDSITAIVRRRHTP